MTLLRRLVKNSDGAVSWRVLTLLVLTLSLPFGLGLILTSRGGPALSVQVQQPAAPNPEQPDAPVPLKMIQPRYGHTATPLGDGRILITGGFKNIPASGIGADAADIAEVFDPVTGTFSQYTGELPPQSLGPTPSEATSIALQNGWTLSFDLNNIDLPWPDLDFAGTNSVPVPPDANLNGG